MMVCDDLEWWNRRGEGGLRDGRLYVYIYTHIYICIICSPSLYMYMKLWLIQSVV